MIYLNIAANLITFLVTTWAIMSNRVNDGLFGKIALIILCLASLSNITWAVHFDGTGLRSEILFNCAVALMALRCYWIKTHRSNFKKWVRKCSHS